MKEGANKQVDKSPCSSNFQCLAVSQALLTAPLVCALLRQEKLSEHKFQQMLPELASSV